MGKAKLAECVSEIQLLEKQLSDFSKEQEMVKKNLSTFSSTLNLLEKEKEELLSKIKAIGFFKFNERKPYKIKLNEIKKKISKNNASVREFESKAGTLSQQINEAQTKIDAAKEQKERLQREAEMEEKAYKGDPQAQYEMAKKCRDSNFKEALEWLEKAAVQGHKEAQILKTEIENEKIYFKICNNTAWDIVEINVFHESVNTHNWQGRLLSSINGGHYEPVICYFTKGSCNLNQFGWVPISIQYKCAMQGFLMPAVKEESIQSPEYKNSPENAQTIYLDQKFF